MCVYVRVCVCVCVCVCVFVCVCALLEDVLEDEDMGEWSES